jgi:hypothetical protein
VGHFRQIPQGTLALAGNLAHEPEQIRTRTASFPATSSSSSATPRQPYLRVQSVKVLPQHLRPRSRSGKAIPAIPPNVIEPFHLRR